MKFERCEEQRYEFEDDCRNTGNIQRKTSERKIKESRRTRSPLYDWRVTLKLFRSTHRLHPTGRERQGVGVIGVKRRDGGRLKRDELKCSGSVKGEGGSELKSSLVSIIAAV